MQTKAFRLNGRTRIALAAAALTLLAAWGFFYAAESNATQPPSALDYFKGTWAVTMKSNPGQPFRWTVRDDLRGGWVVGVVEQNGERISTDFWRQDGKKIERFAFTGGGLFVRLESAGWEAGRLVLDGVASDQTGETRIRETITKENERRFQALWERQDADGR
ncbi:MAG TPA: hypothetical protein VD861_07090, partial [Pyrinomonadaceae bacterium]|nr:hypothetical protein [Pyrinomonadaceae bacterium]